MARCLSVCLSVCHKPMFYWNGWMDRGGSRHWGHPRLILHDVATEFGITKNKGTSIWNFVPNSERSRFFCFFRHGTSTVASAVNLVRPSQVYHTERSSLFTTRWSWRRGSSATADTCSVFLWTQTLIDCSDLADTSIMVLIVIGRNWTTCFFWDVKSNVYSIGYIWSNSIK